MALNAFNAFRQRSSSESSLEPETRITLKPFYASEREAEQQHPKHYFNPEKLEKCRINAEKGVFTTSKGIPVERCQIYVLFLNYELYCCDFNPKMHHSFVSGGEDLKGVGNLYFHKGKLITVSNESGHYLPTFDETKQALRWFLSQSQQASLLFEDHSQHMPGATTLDGIRYFRVFNENDKLTFSNELTPEELVNYLDERIERVAPPIIERADNDDESESVGDNSPAVSSQPLPHPIMAHGHLAAMTFIPQFFYRKLHNVATSRAVRKATM